MAIDTSHLPFKKSEPRKRIKGREKRRERVVIGDIRSIVADRDYYCRLYWFDAATRAAIWAIFGACRGASEWAHRHEESRAKTRGMGPERHTTKGTLMLCAEHHQSDSHGYDRHKFEIEALTEKGCDSRLRFVARDGRTFEEPG